MRKAPDTVVLKTLGTLFHLGTTGEWSDGDLVECFVARHDETRSAAFEVLVNRHGPMVLDVCRNVLRDDHDAEDAFQATFLILARQARSIRRRGSVGSWLFGVATRVASRARVEAARRRARERVYATVVAGRDHSNNDNTMKTALHEEIARLPEKYREPVVLCDLEGLPYKTAADRLGCPVGTVSVRLMRARERLRTRLAHLGVADTSGPRVDATGPTTDRPPVAPALIASVSRHAVALAVGRLPGTGAIPASIHTLVQGVTMTMLARHLAARVVASLLLGGLLVGSGALAFQVFCKGSHPAENEAQPAGQVSGSPRADVEDPSRKAENRAKSVNNLRQLALAIMAFEQANGYVPWASLRDLNSGKPLLSWRVLVLPLIGSQDLYQQFHLSEAWDSPHNKTLLAKMPAVYAPVGVKANRPFTTFYQVFVGPGTAFEILPKNGTLRLEDIRDGAANTLTVVEAGEPVPWTKPEDLPFQPDQPLPRLGGLFKDGFNAGFLDGAVFSFARDADERRLKGLITRDGGESVLRQQLPQIDGTFAEVRQVEFFDGKLDGRVFTEKDHAVLEQLSVSQEACKAIEQRRRRGDHVSDEEYHKWSLRLLEAERASSKTRAEEVAPLEAHCARMDETRKRAKERYKSGQMDLLKYLDIMYWHKEAAAWLDKAKQDAGKPSRP